MYIRIYGEQIISAKKDRRMVIEQSSGKRMGVGCARKIEGKSEREEKKKLKQKKELQ